MVRKAGAPKYTTRGPFLHLVLTNTAVCLVLIAGVVRESLLHRLGCRRRRGGTNVRTRIGWFPLRAMIIARANTLSKSQHALV